MADEQLTPVILSAKDLCHSIGTQVLLDHAELSIHQGEHLGLVGRNGTGKTTLLNILGQVFPPDSGNLQWQRNLSIGYLPQEFQLNQEQTARENILDGARQLVAQLREFEQLPADSKRHHELEMAISAHDGWNLETRLTALMHKLNVLDSPRPVGDFSGGEQRRIALCRALISEPDLLILDEPTNHLDTQAIEWIENFLRSYRGTCLMVTHDRYFLDRIASRMLELSNGTLYSYTGNYTDFLAAKAKRLAQEEAREGKRQNFLRREVEWIRRGPKARTTKAQYRVNRFHEINSLKGPEKEENVELVIPPAGHLGNRILEINNLGITLGDKTLFNNLTLNFERGTRIGIVGPNGAGKTTLLRLILKQLEPTMGEVKVGDATRFNYIDQGRQQLNEDQTVYHEAGDGRDSVRLGDHSISIHGYLRRFLFTDERIHTIVKHLSGGERNRLLLAKQLKNGGNFLILDEPTNDLDLATLRILEEALTLFDGCVLVVSHDRYFLNRVCTGILAFENDNLTYQPGDYDYYRQKRQERENAAQAATAPKPKAAKPKSTTRKLKWKEQRELEGMEESIATAEAEVERLEALFLEPDFYEKHGAEMPELTAELEDARTNVEQLYARWEELETMNS
jgi:ATP-binding cassette subfamily F protein uup